MLVGQDGNEPDNEGRKKCGRRQHHTCIGQHQTKTVCAQRQQTGPQRRTRGTVEQHCKSTARNEAGDRTQQKHQRIGEFRRQLTRQIDISDRDNNAEAQRDRQQNHRTVCQATDSGDGLVLQQIEKPADQGKTRYQEQYRRHESGRKVRNFEAGISHQRRQQHINSRCGQGRQGSGTVLIVSIA